MTLAISFRFLALTVWILLLLAWFRTAALLLAGLLPRILVLLARLILLARLVLVGHLEISVVETQSALTRRICQWFPQKPVPP
jgi:hypothetical protein